MSAQHVRYSYPLTVYYDSSCPLCDQEIRFLKICDIHERLLLVDCSSADFAGIDGHSRAAMMAQIHARDGQGQWLVGVPVFAAAYAACELNGLARLWAAPRLQPLWQRLYPHIAAHRQWLSALGLHRLFAFATHWSNARAARQAHERSQACKINAERGRTCVDE